jgi:hypothetical protein
MTAIHIKCQSLTVKACLPEDESRRLGDEFLELAANGRLGGRMLTL